MYRHTDIWEKAERQCVEQNQNTNRMPPGLESWLDSIRQSALCSVQGGWSGCRTGNGENKATAKYGACTSCAWLLLSFLLFPVRHPLHPLCRYRILFVRCNLQVSILRSKASSLFLSLAAPTHNHDDDETPETRKV